MPGNPNEIKLVNNAMSNATRRKIMNFLVDGDRSTEEVAEAAGKTMLDFHLKLLQQANLIELGDGTVRLSEYGRNFLKGKEEKDTQKKHRSLSGKTCGNCGNPAAFTLYSRLLKIQGNCKYDSPAWWNPQSS